MLADPSYAWHMLGLAALQQGMVAAKVREMAQPLAEHDPEPIVKQFAAATIAVSELIPSTTAPSTAPTTQDKRPRA